MINILHITPNFNYSCGRSKLAFMYLQYFSNKNNYQVHFITNGGDSFDRLKALPNLHYGTLNFSTGYKNILFKGNFYRTLKDYVLKNKIDLIHTHHRFPETIVVKMAREVNVQTVASAHSFIKGFKRWGFNSDKVIAVSNSVKNYLIERNEVPSDRILTLYNPVEKLKKRDEVSIKSLKAEKKITEKNKIILFVGRFCHDKGFDTLIKAFEIVKSQSKNFILIIVGKVEENRKAYSSILMSERVFYVPPQSNIQNFYEICDLVVLPSRIDPFPFVMLEAGVHKKPFIGGNTGGIAEFIENGKSGLLVDPENPEQLAEKISFILNNPEIGKSLVENLHEKVSRLCDHNNYFSRVEKIYNSLITV